jgi:hypothetical protein
MKDVFVTLCLSTIAIALPQTFPELSSAAPIAPKPSITNPPVTPKVPGKLPKDGLNGLPFPDFGELASQLGFDPAKATPDPSGPSE